MAQLELRLSDLRAGRVPRVCVKTGARADGTVSTPATRTPAWTYLLIGFGVIPLLVRRPGWSLVLVPICIAPFIVARYVTTRRSQIDLPASQPTIDVVNSSRKQFFGYVVLGIAVAALAFLIKVRFLVFGGVAVWLGGYGWMWWRQLQYWVGVELDDDGERVWITRAHPHFAREAGRDVGRRRR